MAPASSPFKNAVHFHDVVDHMVSTLSLPVEETSQPVSDILSAIAKQRISLTILDGLLQLAKSVWSNPVSCQLISKKENKL